MTIVATAIFGNLPDPLIVDAGSNTFGSDEGPSSCGTAGPTGTPGASVSGGQTPYTFLWEQIGTPATSGPYNVTTSTILNPTWNKSVCDADALKAETWRLTVTDDNSETANDTILVSLDWLDNR